MTFKHAQEIRSACLSHAEELLVAARCLLESHPHLSYHFATLALEEIGKIVQTVISISSTELEVGKTPPNLESDNHIQKLFWALWSPSSISESCNLQNLEQCRTHSREIHSLRLAGLYVDWTAKGLSIPRDAIAKVKAVNLVDLAQARLNLALVEELGELDDERKGLMRWFIEAIMDDEKAKLILGKKSLDKLSEMGRGPSWYKWLRNQFEEAEQESKSSLKKELERTEPDGEARGTPKWKIKIRVQTPSHSIRQPDLNWFNAAAGFIRLDRGRDSRELFITMTMPSAVSVHSLWEAGYLHSRKFVAALNIGSFGLFWWQLPVDVSKYYEKIIDIDNGSEVRIERVPALILDWGNNVLDKTVLFHAMLVYRHLSQLSPEMLNHYLTGLGFMGKSDIHNRMEPYALLSFYRAFKAALMSYGEWDGQTPIDQALHTMFERDFSGHTDWLEPTRLGAALDTGLLPSHELTLSHVSGMKMYLDAYLVMNMKAQSNKAKELTV